MDSFEKSHHHWKLVAFLKFLSLFLLAIVSVLIFLVIEKNKQKEPTVMTGFGALLKEGSRETILTIPYQKTLYKHFGNAINPLVEIPVKTVKGYEKYIFLLDSGAVVSALPKTSASDLGINLASLPRITIEGFAGQKTFAYRGEFVILIGDEEIVIPVVFSENPQASNILGRLGFFDEFNIFFNAQEQTITIEKKGAA